MMTVFIGYPIHLESNTQFEWLICIALHITPDLHPNISRKCCSPNGKCLRRTFISSTLGCLIDV